MHVVTIATEQTGMHFQESIFQLELDHVAEEANCPLKSQALFDEFPLKINSHHLLACIRPTIYSIAVYMYMLHKRLLSTKY